MGELEVCSGQGINPDTACLHRYQIEIMAGKIQVAVDGCGGDTLAPLNCPASPSP